MYIYMIWTLPIVLSIWAAVYFFNSRVHSFWKATAIVLAGSSLLSQLFLREEIHFLVPLLVQCFLFFWGAGHRTLANFRETDGMAEQALQDDLFLLKAAQRRARESDSGDSK